jgi:hypothetical protein
VLARIEVPIWPGMTTEHLMCGALIRRSVINASVNPLTANFAAEGGMRDAWPDSRADFPRYAGRLSDFWSDHPQANRLGSLLAIGHVNSDALGLS